MLGAACWSRRRRREATTGHWSLRGGEGAGGAPEPLCYGGERLRRRAATHVSPHVSQRSLLDWLRGDIAAASADPGAATAASDAAGTAAASADDPAAASMVLAAAGLRLDVGQGHRRLAEWVCGDLRGARRAQVSDPVWSAYVRVWVCGLCARSSVVRVCLRTGLRIQVAASRDHVVSLSRLPMSYRCTACGTASTT